MVFASLPFGAVPHDTGEYMLGRIAVTPVLLESNGEVDTDTENWDAAQIADVMAKVNTSLEWWSDLLATQTTVHTLDFVVDTTFATNPVETKYEPINRVSNDFQKWVDEFLDNQGFSNSMDLESNVLDFNNAQRLKWNADWSFTIFVVNSKNDGDGTFRSGGSFSRAFAFPGGLFYVVPSTRPASTFAHETGHIFYTRDEYSAGDSYYDLRGYYNTQNTNAIDNNPDPNFVQAPSIMAAGDKLFEAYDKLISPANTLAMLGWQDSDGDGIFDVLDVPLKLNGVGRFEPERAQYTFKGSVSADTLPNRNSWGLQNDITINKVDRIEYRFNGGQWQTALTVNAYTRDLSFSIPTGPRTIGTIELRAVANTRGVVSNTFAGALTSPADATWQNGINGFVWSDADADAVWDASERPMQNWTVQLVDENNQELALQKRIEPDDKPIGLLSSGAYFGVSITAVGLETDGGLGVFVDGQASTGTKVFRPYSMLVQDFLPVWRGDNHQLKIEFTEETSFASVDIIGGESSSFGRIDAYSFDGELLDRVNSRELRVGEVAKLELSRDRADIAYVIVKGASNTAIKIDNFRYGPKSSTKTDGLGRYQFTSLPTGDYRVKVTPPSLSYVLTSPSSGIKQVAATVGQVTKDVNFGGKFEGSPWHNFNLNVDVNDSGTVTPLDALLIINLLNSRGIGPLNDTVPGFPYVDTSNNQTLEPLDALLVINYLNSNRGGGEGEFNSGGTSNSGSGNGGTRGGGNGESDSSIVVLQSNSLGQHTTSDFVIASESTSEAKRFSQPVEVTGLVAGTNQVQTKTDVVTATRTSVERTDRSSSLTNHLVANGQSVQGRLFSVINSAKIPVGKSSVAACPAIEQQELDAVFANGQLLKSVIEG